MTGFGALPVWCRLILTIGAGLVGGYVFFLLRLPAPWLSGALVGAVLLILTGVKPVVPDPVRDLGMLFAGALTGSAITPEMLRALERYPLSLLILALTTLAIVIAGRLALVRLFGWDRNSAMFASVPGALSAVIAAVSETRSNMLPIVAVQSFRMFVLVAVLPSATLLAVREVSTAPPDIIGPLPFALMMVAAVLVAWLFQASRIMAPFLLGGMAAAGLLHVTGLITGSPPVAVVSMAMVIVGVYAGSRFSGLDFQTVRSLFLPGILLLVVTVAVAALGALLTARFANVPLPEALVAFAPGGLEAMVVLGLAMGLDPLYVSSHHVARFVMIAAALPFLARRATGRNGSP
ncbi:MAG: AbrB family transcriptional regulator [Beijerinckiaceae bacterium]|nr:AbrB family transcriptional regulator [Beijerinckiaceae bacterium]